MRTPCTRTPGRLPNAPSTARTQCSQLIPWMESVIIFMETPEDCGGLQLEICCRSSMLRYSRVSAAVRWSFTSRRYDHGVLMTSVAAHHLWCRNRHTALPGVSAAIHERHRDHCCEDSRDQGHYRE